MRRRAYYKSLKKGVMDTLRVIRSASYRRKLQRVLHKERYLREFGTVHIGLPRRLGNTTLATDLLEEIRDAILITISEEHIENTLSMSNKPELRKRITTYRTENLMNRLKRAKVVIMDMATYIPDTIYDKIEKTNCQAIVAIS